MANQSVLELAVGTGKWDAGLKKAQQSLNNFTQAQGGLQQALAKDNGDMQKFVQMMAKMDSTANTAKGQMNDYKRSIEQLSAAYNQMSSAQQASIGQDYLKTIDALKQKFQDAKQQCDDLSRSLNGINLPDMSGGSGGGLFKGLGDKMSGALQVFAGNMMTKAAGSALEFAGDIGECVKQGIELARQGEGIRIAFERLNQPGLLNNLREATHGTVTDLELMKAAVKFNDFKLPLDQLGAMLAFAQKKAKDTGQSVDYMVESITNGLGRQSKPILDNLGISAKEIEERMKSTGDFTKAVGEIIRDQMSKAGDYVETAADRATQADVKLKNAMEDLGRTFEPLTSASGSLWNSIKVGALNALNTAVKPLIHALAEAGILGQGARSSAGFNNLGGNSKVDRMIGRLGNGKTAGAYSIYQQQLGEFDKYINNKRFQIAAYGGDNSSVAQSAKAKLQTELDGALKMRADYVKRAQELHNQVPSPFEPASTSGGDKSGKGGSGSKSTSTPKSFFDMINKVNLGADALKGSDIKDTMSVWASMTDEAKKSMLGLTQATEDLGDAQAKLGESKVIDEMNDRIRKQAEEVQKTKKAWTDAAQAVGLVGNVMSSIKDPAAQTAGAVAQAIANIALAYSQALGEDGSIKSNIWYFIAASAAAMTSMVTTISQIHSSTGYAQGGIVKGNSYSGDNVPAMVDGSQMVGLNAGEVVLTRAMQSNLANTLEGGGMRTLHVVGKISGTDILLSADRSLRLQGKELAVWGRG